MHLFCCKLSRRTAQEHVPPRLRGRQQQALARRVSGIALDGDKDVPAPTPTLFPKSSTTAWDMIALQKALLMRGSKADDCIHERHALVRHARFRAAGPRPHAIHSSVFWHVLA